MNSSFSAVNNNKDKKATPPTCKLKVKTDIINYASKYATKLKAKVFGHDQMKFNEVELLKPGKPEKQHIAITTVRKTILEYCSIDQS